ncbi:outer membrane lipoprotein chaperone LolA [Pantoea sp. Aalb]|uniref:outer membrane lipoprotein chaperone LolA n=1 Tax=Pantoea sp. Aalb TaxID=2576762 RepID=UPI00132106EF|nr:outer membrane lipoprotein chaperone LolA [Pantoea sp. Aalb]MXP67499.1 outer membrane lipoprotein chaperone LolA [Pantoea sp. Aalb]
MNLRIIICYLLIILFPVPIKANAVINLQQRLNKIKNFYAVFEQQVTNSNNINVQNGRGELWIKRPNLFKWHMTTPDENTIISDGKNLWFYNSFIKEVSVSLLKNFSKRTPLIPIINNSPKYWKQYDIIQQNNSFIFIPKDNDDNLRRFTINITSSGIINYFNSKEQSGKCISFQLKNQKTIPININKFIFKIPKGVSLDDQR